jgi:hypothetical protein
MIDEDNPIYIHYKELFPCDVPHVKEVRAYNSTTIVIWRDNCDGTIFDPLLFTYRNENDWTLKPYYMF